MTSWKSVLALAITGLAALAVLGGYPLEGPALLTLTSTHGVHAGDLVIALLWGVAMTLLLPERHDADPIGAGTTYSSD